MAWEAILPALVKAYMAFDSEGTPMASDDAPEFGPVIIVGLFGESYSTFIVCYCLLSLLSL